LVHLVFGLAWLGFASPRNTSRRIASPRISPLRIAALRRASHLPATQRLLGGFHGWLIELRIATLRFAPRLGAPQRYATSLRNSTQRRLIVKFSIATLTLRSLAPYSQSRAHDEDRLEGENHEDYDKRTWRHKLNVEERDGKKVVVIPAHGLMQAFTSGAKYCKKQIPGQGKATWTAKFAAGITIPDSAVLDGIDPDQVQSVTISANADGMRGSGKRVPRRFPIIPAWRTTFDVWILDPIIGEAIFREMVNLSGLYVGLGRFRPEKGGTNGRFVIDALKWQDNREPIAA
jgi:hypothetical protein